MSKVTHYARYIYAPTRLTRWYATWLSFSCSTWLNGFGPACLPSTGILSFFAFLLFSILYFYKSTFFYFTFFISFLLYFPQNYFQFFILISLCLFKNILSLSISHLLNDKHKKETQNIKKTGPWLNRPDFTCF